MKYCMRDGNDIKVTIKGDFVSTKAAILKDEIENLLHEGCNHVTFDFRDTTFIDSVSFRIMVKVRRFVKPDNFIVINPSGYVLDHLRFQNVEDWIKK